ncbi:MAG: response regulator [Gemmatimonadota bacterium]|nr:response regulator [Gemmatimonadota bacterium]
MDESNVPVEVLIVDDVQENLLEIETLLRHPRRSLVTAESGEEALETLEDHEFAAVVLDVHLPGLSGFDVAERIRANPRTQHVPILFVTAVKQEPHHVFVGYELGAVDYLFRPVDPHVLRSKVSVFCDLWAQRYVIAEKNRQLERHLAEIRTLRGLIAVCARCHRIRDDDGLWERCVSYVARHTDAEFTHAYCEECAAELFSDEELDVHEGATSDE